MDKFIKLKKTMRRKSYKMRVNQLRLDKKQKNTIKYIAIIKSNKRTKTLTNKMNRKQ